MKDPAFLFYDGDAAKDVSHMNRLERGCYFDLIQAQRKFGGYTVEQMRKILGKDFEECWPALELILSHDENDVFFIEWVRISMQKREIYSKIQQKRIQNYWDGKKKVPKKIKKLKPSLFRGTTTDIPLENEIVIENNKIKRKKPSENDLIEFFKKTANNSLKNFPGIDGAIKDWIEYREEKKKPLTEKALKIQINLLNNEPDPIAIINKSIQNSWTGLFESKENNRQFESVIKKTSTVVTIPEDY